MGDAGSDRTTGVGIGVAVCVGVGVSAGGAVVEGAKAAQPTSKATKGQAIHQCRISGSLFLWDQCS